ncbi:MAG: hypothetical protein HYX84_08500 [Chloroflexi bacterium]|nr:hypothetical protein [Chloroflexota bacterium]
MVIPAFGLVAGQTEQDVAVRAPMPFFICHRSDQGVRLKNGIGLSSESLRERVTILGKVQFLCGSILNSFSGGLSNVESKEAKHVFSKN